MQSYRGIGWLLLFNLFLLLAVSYGFTRHYPEATSALDTLYQWTLLPGHWGLFALVAFILLFPLPWLIPSRRFLLLLVAIMGGTLASVVFIDSFIYDIYGYHINWFFISSFFADEGGEFFDISAKTYAFFTLVILLISALELFLIWLIYRYLIPRNHFKHIGLLNAFMVVLTSLVNQGVHAWAYEHNYAPVTSLSSHIPFYFPIQSDVFEDIALFSDLSEGSDGKVQSNLNYPLNPVQCDVDNNKPKPNIVFVVMESLRGDLLTEDVAPNMYRIAQQSQWFKDHHSSGNVTTKGLFSLFYGLAPTYMDTVVNLNGAGGPVILNKLKEQGYRFGVFPSGDIERIKLTDTVFLPIKETVEHGQGKDTLEKDRDILKRMISFSEKSPEQPYFGFMFFNSSHYLYYYPEEFEKFTPVEKPSLVDFKQGKKPEPYFNRYRNSVVFMDSLVAKLEQQLKDSGQWDNTLLIITSDHGEEFADTQPTRFGHGSNYSRYQTHVPLFIRWPGKQAKVFDHRTASIDLVPTLMQDLMGCENPIADYSNGENLFVEEDRPVQVMASYYNYAFVTDKGSFTQNPVGLLDARNPEDQVDPELKLDPGAAIQALQQMKHFYKTAQ